MRAFCCPEFGVFMHQNRLITRLMTAFIIIIASYPMSVVAAEVAQQAGFDLSAWGVWSLFAAANAGGIAAIFIKTRLDSNLWIVALAKWFIGVAFSMTVCITWNAYNTEMTAGHLLLFAFFAAAMGANLMIFFASYATDEQRFKWAGRTLDRRLGLDEPTDGAS